MGQLVDGVWRSGPLAPSTGGTFLRPTTSFRNHPPAIEAGRYVLYVSGACPWAHRTLMARALGGLEHAIAVITVDPHMGDQGWPFDRTAPPSGGASGPGQAPPGEPRDPDPNGTARFLHEVYTRADPAYTGRVTVPLLWDRVAGTIVNNESREIMRMFAIDFAPLARDRTCELSPAPLRARIDEILDAIYGPINDGVYRCGFASTQAAYDAAASELFAALARWERELAGKTWLLGDALTEADLALFATTLRFDLVYYSHFKCNLRRLRDHANLWRHARQLWQHPRVRGTCDLSQIKTHYYWSQDSINPSRIVPIGPDLAADLDAPL